jgi:hypothetical protein
MSKKLLCCEILRNEIEQLLQGKNIEVEYLEAGLHTDFKKLEAAVNNALESMGNCGVSLGYGTMCHPAMEAIASAKGSKVMQAKNCIEMLLGDQLAELDAQSRSFYITGGWLANWRKIFVEQMHWDKVDARQNFGFYERILLLDTGLVPIDEEMILEFFDYTEVPIEVLSVNLDNLEKLLLAALE